MTDGNPLATQVEKEFALDVVGLIDFTLRNGVNMAFPVNMLSHDLAEIFLRGSLDRAIAAGVRPKVSDYAQYTPDAVGDPEPEEGQ